MYQAKRTDLMHILKMKSLRPEDFNYDMLKCPPILSMFTMDDIQQLKYLATSNKYSGNPVKKMKLMDDLMKSRGFTKLSAGTNRICYRCIEDNSFVVKVAYDKIGMQDSPAEFRNQIYLKPFCTKIFEVAGDGVISTAERVSHITNREMFVCSMEDIFALLNDWIKGRGFLISDASARSFMNFGIREGFGPVLLDFPYLYRVNPRKKIFCQIPDKFTGRQCGGTIGLDDAYGCMICYKCGKIYEFKDVAEKINSTNNSDFEMIEGGSKMALKLVTKGGITKKQAEELAAKRNAEAAANNNTNVTNNNTSNTVLKRTSTPVGGTRTVDPVIFGQNQRRDSSIIKPSTTGSKLVLKSNKDAILKSRAAAKAAEEEAKVEQKPVVEEVAVANEPDPEVLVAAEPVEDEIAEHKKEEETPASAAPAANMAQPDDVLVFAQPQPTLEELFKDSSYNLVKVLGLLDDASMSDEAKAETVSKFAELAVKIISKLGNSFSVSDKTDLIGAIFGIQDMEIRMYEEQGSVHAYIGDEEDGYYEEENTLDMYSEEEAPAPVAAQQPVEEDVEEEDDRDFSSVDYYNAQMLDISSVVPTEKPANVIVITDDKNVPMTTSNGVIAINMLDGRSVDNLQMVSAEWLAGVVSENETLREAIEHYTEVPEEAPTGVGEGE